MIGKRGAGPHSAGRPIGGQREGTAVTIYSMTSNEYYGMVNKRCDERMGVLRALGFTYERVDGLPVAVMVKRRAYFKEPLAVAVAFLGAADDRAWLDRLEELKRNG